MAKTKRSLGLIATFEKGYAKDWYFAVGEHFKSHLDIRFVERVENGKTVDRLTQGALYSFAEGHTFYDTPDGYLQWSEALKKIRIICEVVSGSPNTNKKGIFCEGQVHFTLSRPNKDKTQIETYASYHLTQNAFVDFLKTGKLTKQQKEGI